LAAVFGVGLLLLIAACRWFEFSPYAAPDQSESGELNRQSNLARLSATEGIGFRNRFRFAVLADVHDSYDELTDAVRRINADTACRFAIVVGDLTQNGLAVEYEWLGGILLKLSVPFFVIIGNHDALANGERVYRNLFGSWDFSFKYRGVQFTCFNDNVWEFPGIPDLAWLEDELAQAGDSLRVFTVSHIPPYGDQFGTSGERELSRLQARMGVDLSIHGHQHNHHLKNHYGDGIPYLTVDDVGSRNYVAVTVSDAGFVIERIFF
jgi:3',5'-cyclic AMP phosphodiesterase CpdA